MSEAGARDGFELSEAVEVLTRTPVVLRALLGDLCGEWIHGRVSAESWSPYDVVGHLIHGERTDWVPRMRRILEHGEEVPFDPFDREEHRTASQGLSLGELLATFARLRKENLELMDVLGLDERHLDLALRSLAEAESAGAGVRPE
jgi:hypothetical protein